MAALVVAAGVAPLLGAPAAAAAIPGSTITLVKDGTGHGTPAQCQLGAPAFLGRDRAG